MRIKHSFFSSSILRAECCRSYEAADGIASMIEQLSKWAAASGSSRLLAVQPVEDEVEEHEEGGQVEDPCRRFVDEVGRKVLK